MPHYSYLLFDADNTLFDFDAANRNAFHAVCRQCDIPDAPFLRPWHWTVIPPFATAST